MAIKSDFARIATAALAAAAIAYWQGYESGADDLSKRQFCASDAVKTVPFPTITAPEGIIRTNETKETVDIKSRFLEISKTVTREVAHHDSEHRVAVSAIVLPDDKTIFTVHHDGSVTQPNDRSIYDAISAETTINHRFVLDDVTKTELRSGVHSRRAQEAPGYKRPDWLIEHTSHGRWLRATSADVTARYLECLTR